MRESESANPVLVEVIRGTIVESSHSGAIAIADADGRLVLALGDVERPVYPRSAVKALQAIPLVESGAADAFGLGDDELAVACASHSGDRGAYRGGEKPARQGRARRELSRLRRALAGERQGHARADARRPPPRKPSTIIARANMPACSPLRCISASIRAAMSGPTTRCRVMIAGIISETCGVRLDRDGMGIDGCSVPTWSLPLGALARGFARLGTGEGFGAGAGRGGGETARRLLCRAGSGGGGRALRHHRHARARARPLRQGRRRGRALRGAAGAWAWRRAQGRRRRQARGGACARRSARRAAAGGAARACRSARRRDRSIGGASASAGSPPAPDFARALGALDATPRRQAKRRTR